MTTFLYYLTVTLDVIALTFMGVVILLLVRYVAKGGRFQPGGRVIPDKYT